LCRALLTRHTPVHVTLRLSTGLPNLRRGKYPAAVVAALSAGKKSPGFSLVHYSIQSNHLHLIVEAADNKSLARGMKALNVRVARAINRKRHVQTPSSCRAVTQPSNAAQLRQRKHHD